MDNSKISKMLLHFNEHRLEILFGLYLFTLVNTIIYVTKQHTGKAFRQGTGDIAQWQGACLPCTRPCDSRHC